jgi:hypothetical protein
MASTSERRPADPPDQRHPCDYGINGTAYLELQRRPLMAELNLVEDLHQAGLASELDYDRYCGCWLAVASEDDP